MFKLTAIVTLILCLGAVTGVHADDGEVVDPMRPPTHVPVRRSVESPSWNLSAILVSPGRRLAMINDRLVGVGGVVNGARVKSIRGNVVELEVNGRSMTLRPGTRNVRQ